MPFPEVSYTTKLEWKPFWSLSHPCQTSQRQLVNRLKNYWFKSSPIVCAFFQKLCTFLGNALLLRRGEGSCRTYMFRADGWGSDTIHPNFTLAWWPSHMYTQDICLVLEVLLHRGAMHMDSACVSYSNHIDKPKCLQDRWYEVHIASDWQWTQWIL